MSIRDMLSSSFIPSYFKEIFKHSPHILVDLIPWKEIFSELAILTSRLKGTKNYVQFIEKMNQDLKTNLPEIVIVKNIENNILDNQCGEKILKLYFYQIMESEVLFLDFRKKHFTKIVTENEVLMHWHPGYLWASFDKSFRDGLRNVYLGYYGNDNILFRKGLVACKLIHENWPDNQKKEVENVFQKHFSNGKNGKVFFNIKQFQDSFGEIFKILLENKITLDKNFLYLGIMLITLYMTLSEIEGDYEMSRIFNYRE